MISEVRSQISCTFFWRVVRTKGISYVSHVMDVSLTISLTEKLSSL